MSDQTTRRDAELTEIYLGPRKTKIPTDWSVENLGSLCEMHKGRSPMPKSDKSLFGGNIPWVKISDITGRSGKLLTETEEYVTEKGAEKSRVFPAGSLIIGIYGATRGELAVLESEGCTHEGIVGLFDISEKLDRDFLYYSLSEKNLRERGHGAAQKNLNIGILSSVDLAYPSLQEQRQISNILSTVDRLIEQTGNIIEEVSELRQGLSSDLLSYGIGREETQSTPVGPVPISWEIKRGHELISLRNGKYISADERSENAEYPVYGGNGIMAQYDDWLVEPETIIIGRVGAYCGNVHLADSKAWVTDNAIIARVNKDKVEPYFLAEVLRKANLKRFASRSAQPRISQNVVGTLSIPLPNKKEQKEIGDLLRTVDKRLEQEREYQQTLQELKKGLMQDLLTGRTRTNVDT